MRRVFLASVCMFGIGVGCVAATVAQQLVVPPIRAGTNPQRWEQMCVPYEDEARDREVVRHRHPKQFNLKTGWNRVLAGYGQEGWEFVQFVGWGQGTRTASLELLVACFKRPLH